MNHSILNYLYDLCLNSSQKRVFIPSVRWLVIKFNISQNEVVKTLNFWKEQNILITEQGAKSYLLREFFLNFFKNDTFLMFGQNVKRAIISQKIRKKNGLYEYKFVREFSKDQQIVSLSTDFIYTLDLVKINIDHGIDAFIKKNIFGKKNVFKKIRVIDITNMEEYKKINSQFCVLVEVQIFNKEHQTISHSYSLTPIKYYQDFKIEMML